MEHRVDNDFEDYIARHTTPCDAVLADLMRQTYLSTCNPRMIAGQAMGKFLEFVCNMLKPKRILEIGTFTGFATICMTRGALPDVRVDTIEVNDELADGLRQTFKTAQLQNFINLHIADAIDFLHDTNAVYDLIYIDGDKRQYPDYYSAALPHLCTGGFMIADNVLWGGKVYDGISQDAHTQALRQFNQLVQNDTRVQNTVLAVRDGLMFIKKMGE